MHVDVLVWRVARDLAQALATILKLSGEFFWVKAKKSATLKPYSAVWPLIRPTSIAFQYFEYSALCYRKVKPSSYVSLITGIGILSKHAKGISGIYKSLMKHLFLFDEVFSLNSLYSNDIPENLLK